MREYEVYENAEKSSTLDEYLVSIRWIYGPCRQAGRAIELVRVAVEHDAFGVLHLEDSSRPAHATALAYELGFERAGESMQTTRAGSSPRTS